MSDSPLLEVRNLSVEFASANGAVHAVRNVSFTLRRGEILGIVGESGCGKSATALSLLRLIESPGKITGGEVLFEGNDLLKLSERDLGRVRGRRISMVFQDPTASLNPVMTIGRQIGGVIEAHQGLSREAAAQRARELLAEVGISDPEMRAEQYPHELSGGMRQRVMIAMALSNDPALIVADEPTTALDVTIQAQILDLLRRINQRSSTSIAFISHNLGVVAETCTRVAVLYAGRVVEMGATDAVFTRPQHPYTRALLGSLPTPGANRGRLRPIAGAPPVLLVEPSGCAFAPRCPLRMPKCEQDPALLEVAAEHETACWAATEAARAPSQSGRGA